jgi:hypothetical protein
MSHANDRYTHVEVAVAVAVVAFPLVLDGAFLTAAMAVAAFDVENCCV